MPATHADTNLTYDEALELGPDGGLIAIASRPTISTHHRPGVIILNAGVLHRVGPHRLHVTLARRLAARALPTLRLDLAGIGDSPGRGDGGTFRASAVADARTAMTSLGALTGAERFILIGLCAGADNSIATGLVDDRVAGVVLVDPATYRTRAARLRKLAERVRDAGGPVGAARWAAGVVRRRLDRSGAPVAEGGGNQGRELPPPDEHGAQLAALADRGVAVLCVYSDAHGEKYNHPDQVFELFPALRGRVDAAFVAGSNHVFTERAAQAALLDHVVAWIERRFPARLPAP